MIACVVNEIVVTEPVWFQTYADQVPAILTKYRGEYVVRCGAPERMDRPEPPQRLVAPRFPIRDATSTSRVYIVDGYAG
jgi:uncharacterized protein (DUF1330 family)